LSFEIGKIVNTHGISGEVRVLASTDDERRFSLLDAVDAYSGKNIISLDIERVRYRKQFVILKFKGFDSADSVLPLKNSVLKIPDEQALPLGEDEYYIRDLCGVTVVTDDGEELGRLDDVIFTGANDVYVLEGGLMIPAIKQCVLEVDIAARRMVVRLPKGLRD
jgi:16S rRNA processing protein RimM